jgi:SAM-dependent methyltransferase
MYAHYRRQTMNLLQNTSPYRGTAIHRLFGKLPLEQLVAVMDEYDRIHIHQLENVIREMPLNPLLTRALNEISEYHRRYRPYVTDAASLLDIGVGSGLALQHVIRQNPHLTAAGIDIRDLRLPEIKVPLQLYNGRAMPFADNHFEVSLIFYVLHHCQDARQVLREAIRVTGRHIIIIEEFERTHADETSLDMTERQSHRALGIPPDLPYHLFDQPEFEQILRSHHLVQLEQQLLPSQTTRPVEKYLYVLKVPA